MELLSVVLQLILLYMLLTLMFSAIERK